MKPYRKTSSPCPVCGQVLDAEIVEKNKAMFMRKACPAHGRFDLKIAAHAWYYKGLDSFSASMLGAGPGTAPQSQYTITLAGKCGIDCPACPSVKNTAGRGEFSKAFFREQLGRLKNKAVDINFSGGEPTSRKDLPELVRLIKASGNQPTVITDGIRLADDIKYLKLLKDSGLKAVHLTLNDPDAPARRLKDKAMENLRALNMPVRILSLLIKGVSESRIKALTDYARKEEIVYSHYLCGYRRVGACKYSADQEFLMDEAAETVGRKSGLFTLEDVYCSKKLLIALAAVLNLEKAPYCIQSAMIYVPRGKGKSFGELFKPDAFSKKMDKFERLWPEDKKAAKKFFLAECLPRPGAEPDLQHFYQALGKMKPGEYSPPPFSRYYPLLLAGSNPAAAFDMDRSRRECTDRGFNSGAEKNVPHCLEMMNAPGRRGPRRGKKL